MPAEPVIRTLISINFEWPGFSKSPAFEPRCPGFVTAVRDSKAELITGQEMGKAQFELFLKQLRARLGADWDGRRATAPCSRTAYGLNVVFWRRKAAWHLDGDVIDICIPAHGQYPRTFVAAPLEHENGEKITLGASHLTNTGAKDLDKGWTALESQADQAEVISKAMAGRRRVALGMDSNNRTNLFGGRRYLVKHDWTITGSGIDIVACLPGVVAQGKPRSIKIPSDHKKAMIVGLTTNTGSIDA